MPGCRAKQVLPDAEPLRGSVRFRLIGLMLGALLLAGTASAHVQQVQKLKGHRTYATNEYVPLYPGDNELRLRGPNVQNALAMHFPPGVVESVTMHSKSADSNGIGEVTARIRVKRRTHGKVRARVTYPNAKEDTLNARIFRRGFVQSIDAPQRAIVGEPIRVTFEGRGFGVAALLTGAPYYDVRRVGASNTSAQFDIVFRQCGTLRLYAGLLHDMNVPSSEVASGEAAYTGSSGQAVEVGPARGASCPPSVAQGASNIPFCSIGNRWDGRRHLCVKK